MNSQQTILVVEDDDQLRKALVTSLKTKGYSILSAADGAAGLKLALNKLPNLIILDLLMPRMNGHELLKLLRQNETARQIPVIVLTNDASPESVKEATASGAPAYFYKASTSLRELQDIISYHLAN